MWEGEMGRDARPVWEGQTRQGKKQICCGKLGPKIQGNIEKGF
jgi:hypothetical protein